ncbi:hypothetical protein [Heyndrickxia coagulans]|uniref:Uncharacterized protein n=1 Tax=Heyndrickxia coagulans TaxID=1398 RepID=A0AAW7CD98_HEYCO|nr:hypothetical protein [Heyndrickxia coagulans]MDL5039510.1 hypothetical protein [Heyndrickxia coagulans]
MEMYQKIERIGPAQFEAEIKLVDGDGTEKITTRTYERCNSIYAAYKSLITALRGLHDCTVTLHTNHHQLSVELFHERAKNTTLANMLDDIITINNIKIEKGE